MPKSPTKIAVPYNIAKELREALEVVYPCNNYKGSKNGTQQQQQANAIKVALDGISIIYSSNTITDFLGKTGTISQKRQNDISIEPKLLKGFAEIAGAYQNNLPATPLGCKINDIINPPIPTQSIAPNTQQIFNIANLTGTYKGFYRGIKHDIDECELTIDKTHHCELTVPNKSKYFGNLIIKDNHYLCINFYKSSSKNSMIPDLVLFADINDLGNTEKLEILSTIVLFFNSNVEEEDGLVEGLTLLLVKNEFELDAESVFIKNYFYKIIQKSASNTFIKRCVWNNEKFKEEYKGDNLTNLIGNYYGYYFAPKEDRIINIIFQIKESGEVLVETEKHSYRGFFYIETLNRNRLKIHLIGSDSKYTNDMIRTHLFTGIDIAITVEKNKKHIEVLLLMAVYYDKHNVLYNTNTLLFYAGNDKSIDLNKYLEGRKNMAFSTQISAFFNLSGKLNYMPPITDTVWFSQDDFNTWITEKIETKGVYIPTKSSKKYSLLIKIKNEIISLTEESIIDNAIYIFSQKSELIKNQEIVFSYITRISDGTTGICFIYEKDYQKNYEKDYEKDLESAIRIIERVMIETNHNEALLENYTKHLDKFILFLQEQNKKYVGTYLNLFECKNKGEDSIGLNIVKLESNSLLSSKTFRNGAYYEYKGNWLEQINYETNQKKTRYEPETKHWKSGAIIIQTYLHDEKSNIATHGVGHQSIVYQCKENVDIFILRGFFSGQGIDAYCSWGIDIYIKIDENEKEHYVAKVFEMNQDMKDFINNEKNISVHIIKDLCKNNK